MIRKILYALVITFILFFTVNTNFTQIEATSFDEIMQGADDFVNLGKDHVEEGVLNETSNLIFNTLLAIAIVIAVVVGMVLGIQFMMAGAEGKAKIKEMLIPYVVSCVVVFGAFGIWNLAVTLLNQF